MRVRSLSKLYSAGLDKLINSQYSISKGNSLAARIAGHQRRRMFARFLSLSGVHSNDTIIDIGVTGNPEYEHSNYLLHVCGIHVWTFYFVPVLGILFLMEAQRKT